MATTPNSVVTVQTPKLGLAQIATADAATFKSLYAAGANGSKIVGVLVASTDTVARVVQLALTRGGVNYVFSAAAVPVASGTDGASPTINLLGVTLCPGLPVDNDGQPYVLLQSGDTLTIASSTTVTSGKLLHATAIAGDF